jgi:hypothetical protein
MEVIQGRSLNMNAERAGVGDQINGYLAGIAAAALAATAIGAGLGWTAWRQRGPIRPLLADRLQRCTPCLRGMARISGGGGIAADGESLRHHDVGNAQVSLPVPEDSALCPAVSAPAERRVPFSHSSSFPFVVGAAFWNCLYVTLQGNSG